MNEKSPALSTGCWCLERTGRRRCEKGSDAEKLRQTQGCDVREKVDEHRQLRGKQGLLQGEAKVNLGFSV